MKIIGLQFEFVSKDNILHEICEVAEIYKYSLCIENDDIHYCMNEDYNILDLPKVISGDEFLFKLKNIQYYLISIEIKAFLKDKQILKIESYNDFINSYCDFIILNYDCNYFRIYCKTNEKLELIYKYLLSKDVTNLIYLTEDNTDLKMSVF